LANEEYGIRKSEGDKLVSYKSLTVEKSSTPTPIPEVVLGELHTYSSSAGMEVYF
jgi:hypothetical protein